MRGPAQDPASESAQAQRAPDEAADNADIDDDDEFEPL
jgi:hypothetical protein